MHGSPTPCVFAVAAVCVKMIPTLAQTSLLPLLLLLLQGLDRIAALTQLQQLTLFNLQLQDLVSVVVIAVVKPSTTFGVPLYPRS